MADIYGRSAWCPPPGEQETDPENQKMQPEKADALGPFFSWLMTLSPVTGGLSPPRSRGGMMAWAIGAGRRGLHAAGRVFY